MVPGRTRPGSFRTIGGDAIPGTGIEVREIHGVPVSGRDLDRAGRCTHYGSPLDIVSIQHPCCGRFHACHRCHEEAEDHPASVRPADEFHEKAVLCGACGGRLTITEYLESHRQCPRCGAGFNPGCALHHPRYFQV